MKNFFVFFLILSVTASIFMACGGAQQSQNVTGGQRVVTQVTPQPLRVSPQADLGDSSWHPQPATSYSTNPRYPQQPAVSNTNGFPIVQQTVTMRVATPQQANVLDYNNIASMDFMEALTNVRVEWEILPQSNPMERVNLMFAAGENLPDMFYAMGFPAPMQITLGAGGLIIPLNDLIEEHAYHYKRLFEHDANHYPSMISVDGNIYAIADRVMNQANQVDMRFWINQPFLDVLGMQIPTTTEEYYRYLVGVRDRDVNRNGNPNDEIPLIGSIDSGNTLDGFLMNAFIYNEPRDGRRMFIRPDGTIDVSYNKPEWRQGVEYLRRLYAENLIAPESYTINGAALRGMVELDPHPVVGSLPSGGPHGFANATGDRRTHYRIVPPLRGPNGVQIAYYNEYQEIRIGRVVITKDCVIPEVVMKWIDYNFTPDWWTRNRYGVLGQDWIVPPPGTPSVTGGIAMYEEILPWGTPNNSILVQACHWVRWGSYDRTISEDPFELEAVLWNSRNVYWPYRFMNSVPSNIAYTVEEARDFTALNTDIISHVNQSLAGFITGRIPLNDANWNTYVQQLDRLGLANLLSIVQTGFDRQWAAPLGYRR